MYSPRLFDIHCDTPFELYHQNQELSDNSLAISLKKTDVFSQYFQVAAIWTDNALSPDDAYADFFKIRNDFFEKTKNTGKANFILAVEGLSLLNNDISRLDKLIENGMKIALPVWKDISCIGGAFNTNEGFTPFGKEAVRKCFENNIIIDLSHSSRKLFDETLSLADEYNKPVIASHSNSAYIFPHERNLSDGQFLNIIKRGGIVGISFAARHLGASDVTLDTVASHILHYLEIGGENHLALGCDFDGTKELPNGISCVADMIILIEKLSEIGLSDEIIDKIFFLNAYRFMEKNLK